VYLAGAADRPTYEDVKLAAATKKAVHAELEDLASCLGLAAVESP
jgi:hypothetical protein